MYNAYERTELLIIKSYIRYDYNNITTTADTRQILYRMRQVRSSECVAYFLQ